MAWPRLMIVQSTLVATVSLYLCENYVLIASSQR